MNHFYFDGSALGKRYAAEVGTALVNHLFASVPQDRMMALLSGAGEVISILVRRKNAGALSPTAYGQAVTELPNEVINSADFQLKSVEDSLVHTSFAFIEKHSLNATDTIVLRSALDVASVLRNASDDLVLVASDMRLIRAAQLEGLVTFNPELDTQAQLDALVAS